MKEFVRGTIRPIALCVTAPVAGFLLLLILEILFDIEVSRLVSSVINLLVVAPIAFVVFPRLFGLPSGRTDTRSFLKETGLIFPAGGWKHTLLGLALAGCTLSGMWLASFLSGEYIADPGTIDLPHLVFSLNPALWEELFYRGVLMILLLRFTGSLRRATVIQVILFGLMHIKGFDVWSWVDVFSVMILALGYTYVAWKTRSLVAGIVFHYFHDALLFFVQLPDGVYTGATENLIFFGLLWLMVGVGCLITKIAVDELGLSEGNELYILKEKA